MAITNPKQLLIEATKYPAAVEAMLPAGAPKLSTMLAEAAKQIPAGPDLPVELPDLPAVPALPAFPEFPGAPAGLQKFVTGASVTEVKERAQGGTNAIVEQAVLRNSTAIIPSPAVGVLPEVISRRGI